MNSTIDANLPISLPPAVTERIQSLADMIGVLPETVLINALTDYEEKVLANHRPKAHEEAEYIPDTGRIRMPIRDHESIPVRIVDLGNRMPRVSTEEV